MSGARNSGPVDLHLLTRCGLKVHQSFHERLGFERAHEGAQLALSARIAALNNLAKQYRGGNPQWCRCGLPIP